jgi:hypothetical protein
MNKKQFDNFTKKMWKRLEAGRKKYGSSYKTMNVLTALEEEYLDCCNYQFMLWLRAKELIQRSLRSKLNLNGGKK